MKKEIQKVRRLNPQSIILIVLLMVGFGIIVLLQTEDSSFKISGRSSLGKGVTAPNFTLSDLDGG